MNLITIFVEPASSVSAVTVCEAYRGAQATAVSAGLLSPGTQATGQLVNV